jgi:cytochrome c biogenesis protein CcdA
MLLGGLKQAFRIGALERLNGYVGRFDARGLGGQAALGFLLGIVWSPCAGPALGAAVGLAMQKGTLLSAGFVMLFFAIGAMTPLMLMAYAGGLAIGNKKTLASAARYGRPALAIFLIFIGLSIVTGFDKSAEAYLTKAMPPWLVDLTTKY